MGAWWGHGAYRGRTFTRSSTMSRSDSTQHLGQDRRRDRTRSRPRTVIGTNSVFTGNLRTAVSRNQRPRGPGVFVSRLHPETKTNDLVVHIRSKTGLRLEVQQLQTRYRSYSSFFVAIDRTTMDRLFDPKLWPSGALVKEYI